MKQKSEFEKFDEMMGQLLTVSHEELQKRLDKEKEEKKTAKENSEGATKKSRPQRVRG